MPLPSGLMIVRTVRSARDCENPAAASVGLAAHTPTQCDLLEWPDVPAEAGAAANIAKAAAAKTVVAQTKTHNRSRGRVSVWLPDVFNLIRFAAPQA